MNFKNSSEADVQKSVLLLSTTEMGLGSILHAFHLPFAGHFLSLNQGLVLSVLLKKIKNRREAAEKINAVSVSSSILKSLSPAGKKLTPMLAISMQGVLFSVGVLFLGVNLIGVWLGMLLLSLWGFIQPLLISYVLFGENFLAALVKLWTSFSQWVSIPVEFGLWVLLVIVSIKCGVALLLSGLIWGSNEKFETRYLTWLEKMEKMAPKRAPAQKKTFLNYWLFFSFLLSLVYFLMSGEKSYEKIWSFVLRPLAISMLLFFIVIPYLQQFGRDANCNLRRGVRP